MFRPGVVFSVMAVLMCFCTAGAGLAFTIPAPGKNLNVQPKLEAHPVIPKAPSHTQKLKAQSYIYTGITMHKARRQGKIVAGGAHWNCIGSQCTVTAKWPRPTVQSCKSLAGVVGAVQSFGRPGSVLNASDVTRCNAGLVVAKKSKSKSTAISTTGFPAIHPPVSGQRITRVPAAGSAKVLQRSLLANTQKISGGKAPAGGGFLPRAPLSSANPGKAAGNLPKHRTGSGFAPRSPGGFVPKRAVVGRSHTVTSSQALEMTGLGAASGGGRTVTSAQALEMTGLGAATGGGRTVTSAQALEMTGLGAASGGGRTVISAQALEMTGLGTVGSGAVMGGGRSVTSAQALEMTGLGAGSSGAASGGGRTVTSAQVLEMTGR